MLKQIAIEQPFARSGRSKHGTQVHNNNNYKQVAALASLHTEPCYKWQGSVLVFVHASGGTI